MSYELYVYFHSRDFPQIEDITELLDLAGWHWALVQSLASLERGSLHSPSTAIGWVADTESADLIAAQLEARHRPSIDRFADQLCVVEITPEFDYRPDPEILAEYHEADLDPDLITRVEKALMRVVFRTSAGSSDLAIEFQWALATAVATMLEAVLEDLEEGTLTDCSEDE